MATITFGGSQSFQTKEAQNKLLRDYEVYCYAFGGSYIILYIYSKNLQQTFMDKRLP